MGQPTADRPNQGRLEFFVDCSANATPEFEGRGGEELATEISNTLARAYDTATSLDLNSLVIIPGQRCWVLNVDIVLLECGGNLFDAVSIAVKAALYNTKIPNVTVSEEEGHTELEISDDPYDVKRLNVVSSPVLITLSKIGNCHLVDASQKEESCCLARVIMGITDKGTVTALKKEGSGSLHPDSVLDMMESGKRVGQALNKRLLEVLKDEENLGSKKHPTFVSIGLDILCKETWKTIAL
ncbi:exosome complex exonuclease RRP42-like [Liolophura sinensis]|uniref:exosome complex exonuclease RRP42-like n=1 Tax=Liolophura sinensis TaxID=3198878 RepID=UPI003158C359